jgi:hypothetical protein
VKTFWILIAAWYVAFGLGCWNVLWMRYFRHKPGAVEMMQDLPPSVRVLKVAIECIFWPALVMFGLWGTLYGRKVDGK